MSSSHFYLVRHAKAEQSHDGDDEARRLTPEGRLAFRAVATRLRGRVRLDRILTSPFARARETAEILSEITGAPVVEEEALASGSSTGRDILALARRSGPRVALVGHNPEMAEAVALAAGRDEKVRPGTIAACEAEGALSLAWLEAPGKGD
jgi:phosphohistidine phosphatase